MAVAKITYLEPDMLVLYREEDQYNIERLTYDGVTDLFVLDREDGDPIFLTEVQVLGTPIGYCEPQKVNQKMLKFRKLPRS